MSNTSTIAATGPDTAVGTSTMGRYANQYVYARDAAFAGPHTLDLGGPQSVDVGASTCARVTVIAAITESESGTPLTVRVGSGPEDFVVSTYPVFPGATAGNPSFVLAEIEDGGQFVTVDGGAGNRGHLQVWTYPV
ncbi:MAG: hypothetical protein JWM27_4741 [Gemmatimonadetes bacterium]|nr:hypothetical protein [Gemmatimonadota bacterium]